MSTPERIRITNREDLVAAVPYLVGFHPDNSIVCLALHDRMLNCILRFDLPEPTAAEELQAAAARLAGYGSAAVLVGYGPADRVEPAVAALATGLRATPVDVLDMLRVDGNRYFSLCDDPNCATDRAPHEVTASAVPAEATYAGVAPLPSRAALEQLIAPIAGPGRDRMDTVTCDALRRLHDVLRDDPDSGVDDETVSVGAAVVHCGVTAVQHAHEAAGRGAVLSDEEVAWLTAVLILPEVRGFALSACDGSEAQRQLWIDVTRRAMPDTTAAPACLLAVTAYLAGDGALANIAVDRALQADPQFGLAHLLGDVLQSGIPPHLWQVMIRSAADNT
ncbi:DUF4192 domain-containing protein [Dactylosporangium salmoneum]|uniref:DUF4192 domain-containing protein n=1 Tax=Dactylosporangium salmoneum TaxID=53361 RepID=A0ABN3GEL5_9ACTN